MSRDAQAPRAGFLAPRRLPAALAGALCLALAGCGAGGFSLEKAEVDRSLYTSDIPPQAGQDAARISDEATIRNAVSSADVEQLAGRPLPWANAGTGARGVISQLDERRRDGIVCRSFVASRESFDGVRLFRGEACTAGAGTWRMERFELV